jgi:K+-sensing histidine kinase KdpD
VRSKVASLRSSVDPLGAAVDRPTRLLGLLWVTGGLLALLWAVTGVAPDGLPAAVAALGLGATVLGAGLLRMRERLLGPAWYVMLTLLGAGVICGIIGWSGVSATGAPAVLFVYVGVFACVALGDAAWSVLPVSAVMHAATLVLRGPASWWGEWSMVWGATLVASILMGSTVAANRRIVRQREQLLDDLRAADETKTGFLRALGHDLSTPAANLAALAQTVLEHDVELGVTQRHELLERLEVNATRLHSDLAALLRLEELTTGPLEATLEQLELDEVVERAMERAQVPAARVDHASTRGVLVAADSAKLEHAIANILSNAVKYGADGGMIRVGVTREEARTVIHVDDEGPGVPAQERDRVFEPLHRARPEDLRRGSGIGLSVVRAFARFHGGESWVEDAPAGGARFCISLPRRDERPR